MLLLNLFGKIMSKTKNILSFSSNNKKDTILSRSEHNISRKNISKNALKVLYRLHYAGYKSYLVGGAVRDLICNKIPKDFDIVTNAVPYVIKKLFSNAFIIGRRFQIVHIRFKSEIIEVSTFRKKSSLALCSNRVIRNKKHKWVSNNDFGTLEDDEKTRDFTINALYYSIEDFSIRDSTGGIKDINNKIVRTIDDPYKMISEDAARIIRAIRLAAKLSFKIDEGLITAIRKYYKNIIKISNMRLKDEILKIFQDDYFENGLLMLIEYNIWELIFPPFKKEKSCIERDKKSLSRIMEFIFKNQDHKNKTYISKNLEEALIFSAVLYSSFYKYLYKDITDIKDISYIKGKLYEIFMNQNEKGLKFTKYTQDTIIKIWLLQQELLFEDYPEKINDFFKNNYEIIIPAIKILIENEENNIIINKLKRIENNFKRFSSKHNYKNHKILSKKDNKHVTNG